MDNKPIALSSMFILNTGYLTSISPSVVQSVGIQFSISYVIPTQLVPLEC